MAATTGHVFSVLILCSGLVCSSSLRGLWQLPLQPDANAPPRLAMACLGQSFYKDFSNVKFVSICDIADFLDNVTTPVSPQTDWLTDFTALWHGTYAGELYDLSRENVKQFSISILRCIYNGATRTPDQP